jgi:hypothetical protein
MVMGSASAASAQFLPKIPPATEPTPAYVPPPPPPPPKPTTGLSEGTTAGKPAQQDSQASPPPPPPEPIPSLVEKDANGKIKVLDVPTELVAMRRLILDGAQQQRLEAALRAREIEVERLVAAHPDSALELRKSVGAMTESSDLGALITIRDHANPILPTTSLLDTLVRSGALTGPQRSRIDQAVRDYDDARRKQWKEDLGQTNVMAIAALIAYDKARQFSYEPLRALDRLTTAGAAKAAELRVNTSIPEDVRSSMPGGAIGAGSFESWLAGLASEDARKAVLVALLPPQAEPQTKEHAPVK